MADERGAGPGPGSLREFEEGGVVWTAEVTGRGAVGGPAAAGTIESVYFRERGAADAAVRLAYLPAGRFSNLVDDELRHLLRIALPLAPRPVTAVGDDAERAAGGSQELAEDYSPPSDD
jgi:hypothetical protein